MAAVGGSTEQLLNWLRALPTSGLLSKGANPYAIVDDRFSKLVWPTPSPGFKARSVVLFSILSLLIVASFANVYLDHVWSKRLNQRMWIVRLVERGGSRYIVLHQETVMLISNVFYAIILIGELSGIYRMYMVKATPGLWDPWRLAFYPVLFFFLWSMSCASAQALGLADSERRYVPGPRALNIIYVGGAIIGVAILTVICTIGGVATFRRYRAFNELDKFLKVRSVATAFNGTVDMADWDQCMQLVGVYFDVVVDSIRVSKIVLWTFAVMPIPVIIVNFSTLALFLLVHHHLEDTLLEIPLANVLEIATRRPARMDRSIRSGEGRTSEEWAQIERRERLKYVRLHLVLLFVGHMIFALLLGAASMWTALKGCSISQLSNWQTREAVLLLPIWITAIIPTIGAVARIIVLGGNLWWWERETKAAAHHESGCSFPIGLSRGTATATTPEIFDVSLSMPMSEESKVEESQRGFSNEDSGVRFDTHQVTMIECL